MKRLPHPTGPLMVFLSLWRNKRLIAQMSKREVLGRYRGSLMGLAWSFFNPLLMLAVYTFFFGVVFKARWAGTPEGGNLEFATILFSGLIVHALFSECLNRAPTLILANTNYVKKVVFPLESLPWVSMGSALFHFAVSFLVLILFYFTVNVAVQWTIIFVPLVMIPFILIILGISWALASLGVYLRDVGQVMGVITTALLFLSPVFYPLDALPERVRPMLYLNPTTFMVEQLRDFTIWGKTPYWEGLAVYFLVSLLTAWLGFAWFQKTRRGFADVV